MFSIIFKKFKMIRSQYINVADRRMDGRLSITTFHRASH